MTSTKTSEPDQRGTPPGRAPGTRAELLDQLNLERHTLPPRPRPQTRQQTTDADLARLISLLAHELGYQHGGEPCQP